LLASDSSNSKPSSSIQLHMEEPAEDAAAAEVKLAQLRALVRGLSSVAVAFSGGVDSSLVLKIAVDELGERAIAVTAVSPSLPSGELEEAQGLARRLGARCEVLATTEVDNPQYQANTEARCYFCKHEVYGSIVAWAAAHGVAQVADGLNLDDLTDRRPGRRAAEEHGVRSPLAEAGLFKAEVRALSRQLVLPTWDKPSLACLSSRIPYGTPVTHEALRQIDQAEQAVRRLGIHQVRVRHHGSLARIEVEPADIALVLAHEAELSAALRALGYAEVTVDRQGYRMGSLNEARR
jgi:pyridinium-3,5-biscarboxylic acid mononucleotide sulfurtransferase